MNKYIEYYIVMFGAWLLGSYITAWLMFISSNPWIVPYYRFTWEYMPYNLLVFSTWWKPMEANSMPLFFIVDCGLWCLFFTTCYYQIKKKYLPELVD